MKTSDLMIYDLIADEYGFPMFVTAVGVDYVYATFEGGPEDDENEYTDKDFAEGNARPIELTPDMLLANGFKNNNGRYNLAIKRNNTCLRFEDMRYMLVSARGGEMLFRVLYVHELQQILRLIGLSDIADNFKIKPTLSKQ